jgi:hypothetical protein
VNRDERGLVVAALPMSFPVSQQDFTVTPDGSCVTADLAGTIFYGAR